MRRAPGCLRRGDARSLFEWFRTAFHEAGHVVAGHVLGQQLQRVTIQARGDANGHTVWRWRPFPQDPRPDTIRKFLIVALAGGVAERAFDPAARGGDARDREGAMQIAEDARPALDVEILGQRLLGQVPAAQRTVVRRFLRASTAASRRYALAELRAAEADACALLERHWRTVQLIACALVDAGGQLSGSDVRALIRAARQDGQPAAPAPRHRAIARDATSRAAYHSQASR